MVRSRWPEAVLFDCDGVLVDSETPTIEFLARWAGDRLALPPAQAQAFAERCRGRPTRSLCVEAELRHAHVDAIELEVLDRQVDAAVRSRALIMDGAEAAIRAIPSILAIVSNASSDWLVEVVGRARLQCSFGVNLFSSDGFCHPKPAPDIYLHALHRLSVAAHRCVAVEDSLPGLHAAVRAGIPTIGFVHGKQAGERARQLLDAGAVGVVNGISSLCDRIQKTHLALG